MQVAADEAPGEEPRELGLEPLAVLERAGDREDTRAVGRGRRDLEMLRGDEHDRLEPGSGRTGGNRLAEVPRRCAAQRLQPERLRGRDRARRDAVLEGVGRVRALELQEELDAEGGGEARCRDQRRHPRHRPVGGRVR